MNRGKITPQPQAGISYQNSAAPASQSSLFPAAASTTQPMLFAAAGAFVIAYFPQLAGSLQTLTTAMIDAAA